MTTDKAAYADRWFDFWQDEKAKREQAERERDELRAQVAGLTEFVKQERRAAAQEMRDRCVAILDRALGSAHLDGYTYTLLYSRIRELPLGSEKE